VLDQVPASLFNSPGLYRKPATCVYALSIEQLDLKLGESSLESVRTSRPDWISASGPRPGELGTFFQNVARSRRER